MEKISSNQASSILKQAGTTIRGLVEENRDLRDKVANYQREFRIEKLAKDMEDKGLNNELSFEEKVASLRGSETSLEVTEEAVKLASPQVGHFQFGDDDIPGGGQHPFETFISTGETS